MSVVHHEMGRSAAPAGASHADQPMSPTLPAEGRRDYPIPTVVEWYDPAEYVRGRINDRGHRYGPEPWQYKRPPRFTVRLGRTCMHDERRRKLDHRQIELPGSFNPVTS